MSLFHSRTDAAGTPSAAAPGSIPPVDAPSPRAASAPAAPPQRGAGPAEPAAVAPPAQPATVAPPAEPAVPRSRTGMVWVTVCGAALLAVALIVFMVQNTTTVEVHFLGLSGSTSLALMLLIAAVGGVVLTLILGSARIIQLRHTLRRRR